MMKRINVMVDEETMALLSQYKALGRNYSWMVRYAVKQYEKARKARGGQGQQSHYSQEAPEGEKVVEYD